MLEYSKQKFVKYSIVIGNVIIHLIIQRIVIEDIDTKVIINEVNYRVKTTIGNGILD